MTKKGTTTVDAPKTRKRKVADGESVRVWSEVGVTVAVSDDPPQFLRFTFGHERLAKNGTQEEIRKTANLVDEFNEAELERRIQKYKRLIRREMEDDDDDDDGPKKESVRDRARKKARER